MSDRIKCPANGHFLVLTWSSLMPRQRIRKIIKSTENTTFKAAGHFYFVHGSDLEIEYTPFDAT